MNFNANTTPAPTAPADALSPEEISRLADAFLADSTSLDDLRNDQLAAVIEELRARRRAAKAPAPSPSGPKFSSRAWTRAHEGQMVAVVKRMTLEELRKYPEPTEIALSVVTKKVMSTQKESIGKTLSPPRTPDAVNGRVRQLNENGKLVLAWERERAQHLMQREEVRVRASAKRAREDAHADRQSIEQELARQNHQLGSVEEDIERLEREASRLQRELTHRKRRRGKILDRIERTKRNLAHSKGVCKVLEDLAK